MTAACGSTAPLLLVSDLPSRAALVVAALEADRQRYIGPIPPEAMASVLAHTVVVTAFLDTTSREAGRRMLDAVGRLASPPSVVIRCPGAHAGGLMTPPALEGRYEPVPADASEADVLSAIARVRLTTAAAGPVATEATDGALEALETLMAVVEAQDEHLAGHSWRVGDLAASIADAMGWTDDSVEAIRTAGRLHDLGMLAVPQAIVHRAGCLSDQELSLVRSHAAIGARIVRPLVQDPVYAAIRGHHERWDGQGYPDRQTGEAIAEGARVLAAAEIFDALVSQRSHREALSEEAALARLSHLAGTALDPVVVVATETVVRSKSRLPFLRRADAGLNLEVRMLPSDFPTAIDELLVGAQPPH